MALSPLALALCGSSPLCWDFALPLSCIAKRQNVWPSQSWPYSTAAVCPLHRFVPSLRLP
jgi:hypothetical protein